MSEHDLDQCAAELNEQVGAAVARVLSGLDLLARGAASGEAQEPTVSADMLADLGIAASGELNAETAWTRGEFRVEAIENAAKPGAVVFQPVPLTPWAREVFALAGKLTDEAEDAAAEAARDAARTS
jgi:ethanolamine ammonia-lyase large subunit